MGWRSAPVSGADGSKQTPDVCSQELPFYWKEQTGKAQGARCIKSKGELGYINVITEDEGMRPACWLDMNRVVIVSALMPLHDITDVLK